MKPPSDSEIYALYRALSPAPLPLNKDGGNGDRLLEAAQAADSGSDLAFLSEPIEGQEVQGEVPAGLLNRAKALGPTRIVASPLKSWRMILAAVLTFISFGSGSYALASTLSTNMGNASALSGNALTDTIDPLDQTGLGLFEVANDLGILTYD